MSSSREDTAGITHVSIICQFIVALGIEPGSPCTAPQLLRQRVQDANRRLAIIVARVVVCSCTSLNDPQKPEIGSALLIRLECSLRRQLIEIFTVCKRQSIHFGVCSRL